MVNPVDNVPVYDVCLLLHGERYYALNSFVRSYYCMECEKTFNNKSQHKCKSEYTSNMCKEKTCLYKCESKFIFCLSVIVSFSCSMLAPCFANLSACSLPLIPQCAVGLLFYVLICCKVYV